jgi:hypothetical protein
MKNVAYKKKEKDKFADHLKSALTMTLGAGNSKI